MHPDLCKGAPFPLSSGNLLYARGRAQRRPGSDKSVPNWTGAASRPKVTPLSIVRLPFNSGRFYRFWGAFMYGLVRNEKLPDERKLDAFWQIRTHSSTGSKSLNRARNHRLCGRWNRRLHGRRSCRLPRRRSLCVRMGEPHVVRAEGWTIFRMDNGAV